MGEHTVEILCSPGYNVEAIAGLIERGVTMAPVPQAFISLLKK